jgi:quercetin dioxygenase-like cupin family protein
MKHSQISHQHAQNAATNLPYKGIAKEFDGDVTLQRVVSSEDSKEVELLAVWFSAGARTRPHSHDVDQVLHIMEGQGMVADENERLVVKAGDVITVPAHAWHWHGATPESAMSHISIRKVGSTTNWEVEEKDWAMSYNEQQFVHSGR